MGGGGATFRNYVLLVVPYTSRRVWGHAPQKNIKMLNGCVVDRDEPSYSSYTR